MTATEFNYQLVSMEDKLSSFAKRLTQNSDDAKDLVQETMLKAISCRDQFAEYTNLKAWTYTIMKNTFINNYRRNTRRNTAFDKTNVDLVMYKNVDTFNVTPDSAYAELEIKKVIDRLDNDSKIPFMMHVEGYKYEEIAQKLDIKLGTVKSRIFLTRKKLMDALKDYN